MFFETNCALVTAHFQNEESGSQLQRLVREIIYDVTELTASKNTKQVSENTSVFALSNTRVASDTRRRSCLVLVMLCTCILV